MRFFILLIKLFDKLTDCYDSARCFVRYATKNNCIQIDRMACSGSSNGFGITYSMICNNCKFNKKWLKKHKGGN